MRDKCWDNRIFCYNHFLYAKYASGTFGRRRLGAAVWAPPFGAGHLGAGDLGAWTIGRQN